MFWNANESSKIKTSFGGVILNWIVLEELRSVFRTYKWGLKYTWLALNGGIKRPTFLHPEEGRNVENETSVVLYRQ